MIKLTPGQYRELKDALVEAFTLFELRQMLRLELDRDLEAEAGGGNREEVTFSLIGKAEKNNWLPDLLSGATTANPTAALLKIAETLKPAIRASTIDHFNVTFIANGRAMVNRQELRKSLEQLADSAPTGARILVVNGPPVSGKSYSMELIVYLRQALESFSLVWIDLKRFVGEVRPEHLARDIVEQMNLDETTLPPQGQEQDSRWVRGFCSRLQGKLNNSTQAWWLVIDGFNHLTLSSSVNDLIWELSHRIRMTLPGLRMVLLSYPESLPSEVERVALRETISPINEKDLINFFNQLYQEHSKAATAKDIAERISEVLRSVDPKDPRRLETLGVEVARVSKCITG